MTKVPLPNVNTRSKQQRAAAAAAQLLRARENLTTAAAAAPAVRQTVSSIQSNTYRLDYVNNNKTCSPCCAVTCRTKRKGDEKTKTNKKVKEVRIHTDARTQKEEYYFLFCKAAKHNESVHRKA